jgi:hypothetical protein
MPYTIEARREFLRLLAAYHRAYSALFHVIDRIPVELRQLTGLAGDGNPAQVIAALCGSLEAASDHYALYERGKRSGGRYDDKADPMPYISARRETSWHALNEELRTRWHHLFLAAVSADVHERPNDPRYSEWLVGLTDECVRATGQLEAFINARQ